MIIINRFVGVEDDAVGVIDVSWSPYESQKFFVRQLSDLRNQWLFNVDHCVKFFVDFFFFLSNLGPLILKQLVSLDKSNLKVLAHFNRRFGMALLIE